ncbi:Uncharacterized protein SCF082_LOCUS39634 [Durusdinium trenchii]|uniref:Uncharacterized protein n=1 Tax=Durusdinium trenchii TaxID=1381693 RepID=A0ABP0PFZ4_9DINO
MLYCLEHELGLRIFAQPETCHSCWNDVRNGVRRAGRQYVLLLAMTMANVMHGPFKSGRNFQTLQESAQSLAHHLSDDEFNELVDSMASDKAFQESETLPNEKSELPNLPAVTKLPAFADSADEEQSVENNGLDDDDGEPDEAEVPKLRPQTKQELSALRGHMDYQKKLWRAIIAAEALVNDPKVAKRTKLAVKQILDDIAWNNIQLARELCLICSIGNWDAKHELIQEVPNDLRDFIVVLHQCGNEEPLVVAGLKSGVALNMSHLQLLHAHYKFSLPRKGQGSGKNGNVIKIDFVKALLNHLFPDMTEEEKQDLVDGMMGKKVRHVQKKAGKHSKSIIAAFNGLEQEDLREFSKMTEVAMDELRRLTELQALVEVVDWLWNVYEKLDADPADLIDRPSEELMQKIVECFDESTGFVAARKVAAGSTPPKVAAGSTPVAPPKVAAGSALAAPPKVAAASASGSVKKPLMHEKESSKDTKKVKKSSKEVTKKITKEKGK